MFSLERLHTPLGGVVEDPVTVVGEVPLARPVQGVHNVDLGVTLRIGGLDAFAQVGYLLAVGREHGLGVTHLVEGKLLYAGTIEIPPEDLIVAGGVVDAFSGGSTADEDDLLGGGRLSLSSRNHNHGHQHRQRRPASGRGASHSSA